MRGGRHHSFAVDDEDANNAAYVPSEEEQEDEDDFDEEDVSPKKRCCGRTAWLNTCVVGVCSFGFDHLEHCALHGMYCTAFMPIEPSGCVASYQIPHLIRS